MIRFVKFVAVLAAVLFATTGARAGLGGIGGIGLSKVAEFNGTCTVDCTAGGVATIGVSLAYDPEAENNDISGFAQSFDYKSNFGPFSTSEYTFFASPTYSIASASGVIPVFLNGESVDGSLHAADVTISGTVTGLRGILQAGSEIGGLEVLELFDFSQKTQPFDFIFDTNLDGTWSMLLSGNGLPVAATSDAGTNGGFTELVDVTQQIPGTGGGIPVPEPGVLAVFGIGLFGLAVVRRRRGLST